MPPSGKVFRSMLKPPRCGFGGVKKGVGSPSRYSPEEGDGENLDRGVYPCPSWNIVVEEDDKLVGEETLPWVPKTSGQ
jgi:hypothetical protein